MATWGIWQWVLAGGGALLVCVVAYDLLSTDNVLRNFPVVGHLRHFLIEIGPELRQYIIASNREEQPFNREERDWIYRSAKGENNYFGFGTDDMIYGIGYPIIKHAVFPHGEENFTASIHDVSHDIPCAKVLGETHGRRKAWRPRSIINVSAMSFGSLSGHAIQALNRGARIAGCYHNTGEGGVSPHHLQGGDLVWQIGTGYFGCRTPEGGFSLEKLVERVNATPQIRAIEIKLSQGAKPGKGGVLPGRKVSPEIAAIRGIAVGKDCLSPNSHTQFHDGASMIEFIERIAGATGLPVGIKSAVGHLEFWKDLAERMKKTGRGPDFITIDGGGGGTGSAPLTFADHVSLPYKLGFSRVYRLFTDAGIQEELVWIGSGKLGFPDRAIVALCMGADLVNIAREAMLSIGCIQAQKCHTDRCPSGVATQNKWLARGVDPAVQSIRFARFCQSFRNELVAVAHAAGYKHPSQFTMEDVEISAGPPQFLPLH